MLCLGQKRSVRTGLPNTCDKKTSPCEEGLLDPFSDIEGFETTIHEFEQALRLKRMLSVGPFKAKGGDPNITSPKQVTEVPQLSTSQAR